MPPLSRPISRRRLFGIAASAAVAWRFTPWMDDVADALAIRGAGTAASSVSAALDVETLQAFSDTLIPGAKRGPDDRAVAGAASGPGAVQAGAIDMMRFAPAGIAPLLPGLAAVLNAEAATYAAQRLMVPDPTVAPMVALDFDQRTELVLELLTPTRPDYAVWFALAAMPFLAFHTAGFLHTVDAVRDGHPGLEAIGFPAPDADGLWRFPDFSYRRRLADAHPGTSPTGSPA
jgi:hypothetical protein